MDTDFKLSQYKPVTLKTYATVVSPKLVTSPKEMLE